MKQDVLLCGVGGQGILSIAYVLDNCALDSGLFLKQPEVHGMAQRGGAVQAHVRVSDRPICSDLLPLGSADLLLSLEPLEALRYLDYLSPDNGWVISDITPFVNIANYPETAALHRVLLNLPRAVLFNGGQLARKAGSPRAQNIVALGVASARLSYSAQLLEKHIATLFASKSERLVNINLNAFKLGRVVSAFHTQLLEAGVSKAAVMALVCSLDFNPWPVPETVVEAWLSFLRQPDAERVMRQVFDSRLVLPVDETIPGKLSSGVVPEQLQRT